MKLNVDKLKLNTLIDIVDSFVPGATCAVRKIRIVGGSPRTEYQVRDANDVEAVGAISTESECQAWRNAAESLLKD